MRQRDTEGFTRMVLTEQATPAWLSVDAPHADVVLSSRVRLMRNLKGFRFPHAASLIEKGEVSSLVERAVTPLGLEVLRRLSPVEREHYVSCRLVSPEFDWQSLSSWVAIDKSRTLSLMVNEEDHLRLQALTAGWSVESAEGEATACMARLGEHLEFAWSPRFGFLSASPFNSGDGRRRSTMMHLIGLAATKRLPKVLGALASGQLVARGLFGESSRGVGAFIQVSQVKGALSEFVGGCEYLIREERIARKEFQPADLKERFEQAVQFAERTPHLSLAESTRLLAWGRWFGLANGAHREVDALLSSLALKHDSSGAAGARTRAVRKLLATLTPTP